MMEMSIEEREMIPTICLTGNPNSFIFISIKKENDDSQTQRLSPTQPPQLLLLPQYNNHQQRQQQQQQQQLVFLQQQQQQQPLVGSPVPPLTLINQPSVLVMQNHQQAREQESKTKEKSPERIPTLIPEKKSRQKRLQQKSKAERKPRKPRSTENKKPSVKKPRVVKPRVIKPRVTKPPKPPIPKTTKQAFIVISQDAKFPEDSNEETSAEEAIRKTVITAREEASTSQDIDMNEIKTDYDEIKEELPTTIDSDEELQDIFVRLENHSYQCNICQLIKHDRRSILSHIYGKHSHLRPYKCNICGKNFKRKYTMKQHELWHTSRNNEPVKCAMCEYKTPSKVSLRYHYYRVHTTDFRFTCEHCGKMFKFKRELIDHMVTHSNLQYICDICGKIYRGEHLLRAHRRLHLDIYKFQCVICKKKLASEDSLEKHLKLHNRTFECNECGMKFPTKHNLIKHRNVHTREQAFTCPICGKVFADHPTQKVHSLTHAGLKPYRCNVCGAGFTQRTPMMLHWRKKHPEETEPPPPVLLKNILQSIEAQNAKKAQQDLQEQTKQQDEVAE